MQYKVESLDGLSEEIAKLYEKNGDAYTLKVEGMPEVEDVSGLKSQVQKLLDEKKEAKRAATQAIADAAEEARKAAAASGDVEALNKSWQQKYDALQSQFEGLNGTLSQVTSGAEASRLAATLAVSGSAEVLLPHIERRLKTEMKDGVPRVVVVGQDGKPSALTVDDLANEFRNNKSFASVIVGSKAGGGGNNGNQGGGAAGQKVISRAEFDTLGPAERISFVKERGTVTDE